MLENKSLNNDEATGLLKVVTDYAYALEILDKCDHQELTIEGTTIDEKEMMVKIMVNLINTNN